MQVQLRIEDWLETFLHDLHLTHRHSGLPQNILYVERDKARRRP